SEENYAIKATYLSSVITKALAIFAGQWPHSSYAVPGGVTCDPTHLDVMQAQSLVDEAVKFFEQIMTGLPLEEYLSIESVSSLHQIEGDFGRMLYFLGSNSMAEIGQSHDRFIVFGDCILSKAGKSIITNVTNVDARYVQESVQEGTVAKAVTYKQKLYEVGPLARGMVAKTPIVKSLHKKYKDSLLTRVFARVYEVALLLNYSQQLLKNLKLDEPSCSLDTDIKLFEFEGIGVVEAARGSLIHKTTVSNGMIMNYEIITPTQWNLSHGTKEEKGIAVEAMVGSKNIEEATFIFRTFDICSVCTTQ
ncbi:MAG: nickel-dependent hydrogenase large subunit, partial [Sulfurovum sp.]|nr:nickel-dependent hydrogenase large subunit [Sulfurovum sp.]